MTHNQYRKQCDSPCLTNSRTRRSSCRSNADGQRVLLIAILYSKGFVFYGRRGSHRGATTSGSTHRSSFELTLHKQSWFTPSKEHAGRVACGFSYLGGSRHVICGSLGERAIEYFALATAVILQFCIFVIWLQCGFRTSRIIAITAIDEPLIPRYGTWYLWYLRPQYLIHNNLACTLPTR